MMVPRLIALVFAWRRYTPANNTVVLLHGRAGPLAVNPGEQNEHPTEQQLVN